MGFLSLLVGVVVPVVAPIVNDTIRYISYRVGNMFRKRIESFVDGFPSDVTQTYRRRIAELRLKSCLPNDIDFFESKLAEFENYAGSLLVTEKGCLRLLFEFEKYYLISSVKGESQLIRDKFHLHPQAFTEFCEILNRGFQLIPCDDEDPQSSLEILRETFDDLAFSYYQERNKGMTSAIIQLLNKIGNSYQQEVLLLLHKIPSKSIQSDGELFEIFALYEKLKEKQKNHLTLLLSYFILFLMSLMVIIFGIILFHSYQFSGSNVDKFDRFRGSRGPRGFFGRLGR